jgi:hypothetical protein
MVSSQPDRAAGVAGSTWLMHHGFTPSETIKLLELRQRYERGAIRQTIPERRLRFARWLVENGRITESAPAHGEAASGSGSAQGHDESPMLCLSAAGRDSLGGPSTVGSAGATGEPAASRRPRKSSWRSENGRRQLGTALLTIGLVILVQAALVMLYLLVAVFAP